MTVLLMILKIIGYILLGILGLLLLGVLIFLFVPVRYKLSGHYKDDIYVKGKVSYLFHIISASFEFKDSFIMKIRILGIPIKPSKGNRKKEPEKEDKSTDKEEKTKENEKDKPSETSNKDGITKIKGFLDILGSDVTKNAWDTCKNRMLKLIKQVLPRKVNVVVRAGLEDPFYTSIIMAIYNVLYVYVGAGLKLYPVYEEGTFEAEGVIKGRILPAPCLYQVIRVLLNKDCRRFLKLIKKEAKTDE